MEGGGHSVTDGLAAMGMVVTVIQDVQPGLLLLPGPPRAPSLSWHGPSVPDQGTSTVLTSSLQSHSCGFLTVSGLRPELTPAHLPSSAVIQWTSIASILGDRPGRFSSTSPHGGHSCGLSPFLEGDQTVGMEPWWLREGSSISWSSHASSG